MLIGLIGIAGRFGGYSPKTPSCCLKFLLKYNSNKNVKNNFLF